MSRYWKPIWNLLSALNDTLDVDTPFAYDTAWDATLHCGDHIIETCGREFTDEDAEALCACVISSLRRQAAPHWIVVPLPDSVLSRDVTTPDLVILGGSRSDKIERLADLVGVSVNEMVRRATHTETSRSQGFYDHTILAIRTVHLTEHVNGWGPVVAQRLYMALWIVLWAFGEETIAGLSTPFTIRRVGSPPPPSHLVVLTKDDWRWGHSLLGFGSTFPFNLDWLADKNVQTTLASFYAGPLRNREVRGLADRFERAAKFVYKAAVEAGDRLSGRDRLEGQLLVNLSVAAEVLLSRGEANKKDRLAVLLPAMSPMPGRAVHECRRAIRAVYQWRNDYVHEGVDAFPKHSPQAGSPSEASLVLQMLARLVCDGPKHLESFKSEAAWFKHMESLWEASRGPAAP